MKLQIIMALSLLGLLSGCASLSDEQCSSPDWYHIGQVDGERGEPARKYKSHVDQCRGKSNAEDQALYLKGWNEKNEKYCVPENGYKAGAYGVTSGEACDVQKYPDFAEQYRLGRSVRELKNKREDVRKDINDAKSDESVLAQTTRVLSILSGSNPYEHLEKKEADLDQKIHFLERNSAADTSPQAEIQYYLGGNEKNLQNYLGAITGSFMGFGLGHAIQGRWGKDGWKWTLGEVGAIGVMVATAQECPNKDLSKNGEAQCSGGNPWAFVAWLGFRVWQGYDLFSYANKGNNVYAMPTANGVLVGYQF